MNYYFTSDGYPRKGHIVTSLLAGLLVCLAIWLGLYFAVFKTAGVRGRVSASNTARNGVNTAVNYDFFHNTCRDIKAKSTLIANAQESYDNKVKSDAGKNDPFGQSASAETQLFSDLQGLKNAQATEAADYNAKAHEQLTHAYARSKDLPEEINPPFSADLVCEGANP